MNAIMNKNKMDRVWAFDKVSSVRSVDEQGFLHVETSNISKATVNPYLGGEIQGWEQMGLDPDKTYYLFRPPEELEKAAPTFNKLPLLDFHIEVNAFDLEQAKVNDHLVGSTGDKAEFKDPYLVNSLVIWKAGAIEGIMSKEQTELSCCYRYELDMTPGEFNGTKYDGRMKNIRGNHVALVDEGRAGPDVVVKDKMPDKLIVKLQPEDLKELVAEAIQKVYEDLLAKDSITRDIDQRPRKSRDENPEGINQYTVGGANPSATAGKATAQAVKSKSKTDHTNAAKAHHEAAKASNNPAIKSWHTAMVNAHNAAASGRSVKFGRNYGDLPKIGDENPDGINQYTGGGTASHAKIAERLYQRARQEKASGNHEKSERLMKQARQHEVTSRIRLQSGRGDIDTGITQDIAKREEVNPKAGVKKYGEVKFADPRNHKYPLDTEAHVKAAASYWGMGKNKAQYSKEDQDKISKRIESAKKRFKIGEYAK